MIDIAIIHLDMPLNSGDILVINGKKYLLGEWVGGGGYNLTEIKEDPSSNK